MVSPGPRLGIFTRTTTSILTPPEFGANALSRGILSGKPGAVDRYINFLKSGSSVYPVDALKAAGVDLSTPQPVEETFQVLEGLIDRLEKLTNT